MASRARLAVSLVLATAAAQLAATEEPPRAAALRVPPHFLPEVDGSRFRLASRSLDALVDAGGLALRVRGATASQDLRVELLGGRPDATPAILQRLPGHVSRFTGPPDTWRTGLPLAGRLVQHDVWPGIDVVTSVRDERLEVFFVVAPGADAAPIGLAWRGAAGARLDAAGRLVLDTAAGPFIDEAPRAWQPEGGVADLAGDAQLGALLDATGSCPVDAAFELSDHYGAAIVRLALGPHDPSRALVIDPAALLGSGFLGGSGSDEAEGVDAHGPVIAVCGWTSSSEATFPVLTGPDLTWASGGATPYGDAFVATFDGEGVLQWAGYIGGSGVDFANAVAVDDAGAVYVCGHTDSAPDEGFPAVTGPVLLPTPLFSGIDGWVAKVLADGTGLVYCGYIDGDFGEDRALAIAVDSSHRAYVGGRASSDEATFPVTVGPDLSFGGGFDGFIARVRGDGTGFDYCGYVGGDGLEEVTGIAVDSLDRAYITGKTTSTQATLPVSVGPDLTSSSNSLGDTFVGRVAADGTGLEWLGYIEGEGYDIPTGIALAPDDTVVVCGYTTSDESTFPVQGGPMLATVGGQDAFVAKVTTDGTDLVWCGFLSGYATDFARAVAVDDVGRVWVVGYTFSVGTGETAFPQVGAFDSTDNGAIDAFVSLVAPNGGSILMSSLLGGSGSDQAWGCALDDSQQLWVAGSTDNTNFPDTLGFAEGPGGGMDAFLGVVTASSAPPPTPTLTFTPATGSLSDKAKAGKDTFKVKGTWAFDVTSPDGAIDPLTEDVTVDVGTAGLPVTFDLPGGSAGWKATKTGFLYKSPKGVVPTLLVKLNLVKGTLLVKAGKMDLPVSTNPFGLTLVIGDDALVWQDTWTAKKKAGSYKFP